MRLPVRDQSDISFLEIYRNVGNLYHRTSFLSDNRFVFEFFVHISPTQIRNVALCPFEVLIEPFPPLFSFSSSALNEIIQSYGATQET